MLITFGAIALFFVIIIAILQLSGIKDRNFSEYAVGGRSFGPYYQAMSFLNTWYPGAMFTAFGGMAASAGVISFYVLSYSLLTVVLMYMMAKPVWIQTRMIIRRMEFQNGMVIQACGGRPKKVTSALSTPIC